MQTKSQKYSNLVYGNVSAASGAKDDTPQRYKSLCKRAGAIFRTVGLVQFLVFIEAKAGKDTHYRMLADHLRNELGASGMLDSSDNNDLLQKVRGLALPQFMNVSRSLLQMLQWHKRLSEVLIAGDADDHGED